MHEKQATICTSDRKDNGCRHICSVHFDLHLHKMHARSTMRTFFFFHFSFSPFAAIRLNADGMLNIYVFAHNFIHVRRSMAQSNHQEVFWYNRVRNLFGGVVILNCMDSTSGPTVIRYIGDECIRKMPSIVIWFHRERMTPTSSRSALEAARTHDAFRHST